MRGWCLLVEGWAQWYGTLCVIVVNGHHHVNACRLIFSSYRLCCVKSLRHVVGCACSCDSVRCRGDRDAAQAYVGDGSGTSWLFAKFRCERSSWNGRELWRLVTLSCEIFSLITRIPVAIIVAKNERTRKILNLTLVSLMLLLNCAILLWVLLTIIRIIACWRGVCQPAKLRNLTTIDILQGIMSVRPIDFQSLQLRKIQFCGMYIISRQRL